MTYLKVGDFLSFLEEMEKQNFKEVTISVVFADSSMGAAPGQGIMKVTFSRKTPFFNEDGTVFSEKEAIPIKATYELDCGDLNRFMMDNFKSKIYSCCEHIYKYRGECEHLRKLIIRKLYEEPKEQEEKWWKQRQAAKEAASSSMHIPHFKDLERKK